MVRPLQNEELFTFGPAYERLVALKNRFDPTNVFRLNANIQPTLA
jgi:FAD/FMN-containing dehydrogenase